MSFLDRSQAAFSHRILENPRNRLKEMEQGIENICLSSGEKRKSAAQKPSVDRKYDSHKHTNRWGGLFLQVPRIKTQWKTTEREGKRVRGKNECKEACGDRGMHVGRRNGTEMRTFNLI